MSALRSDRSHPGRAVATTLVALSLTAALTLIPPARADDSLWPRRFDSASGAFVIYQPQPEDLDGDVLSGRAAFSLQKSGEANPTFGVLWFTERIEIDRDSNTVAARDLDVTKVRLPGITSADAGRYEGVVEREAAGWDLAGSLEELAAGLAATEKERASVADLENAPPRIIFSYRRAILVPYDGDPELEPIEGSKLQGIANTPFAIVKDPGTGTYYLNGANLWYSARDPRGPWATTGTIPAAVRAVVPPDTSAIDRLAGPPPEIVTATEPTELVAIDGQPRYAPLVEGELLYVTNTESDLVRDVGSQALYLLLAGRWFRAPNPDGPWVYVRSDQLPASFSRVPPNSPKGNILASVAGTEEAEDAVADAEIPQTSAIRRGASDFEVEYDGPPDFEPIEGTRLRYAVNTEAQVILADGRYYACDQGVWYVADDPNGPWQVSETRPLEVDDIPPSCPVYDVRYVYVYDATPDYIYMGYLPGYVGCYPYYGTVVYGTGYHYRPWRGRHFYPRRSTWGFHPRYNPWLSRWSFGVSYSSGFLRIGYRWHSGSRHDRGHGRPMWFGPGGYRRPLLADDRTPLRTRTRYRTRSGDRTPANLYNRPENVARVDRTAQRVPIRSLGRPMRPAPNNVFAGKDGKVYQRDTRGRWKVNEGRSWRPTRTPSPSPGSSARDAVRPGTTPRSGGGSSWPTRPRIRWNPAPTPVGGASERRETPQPAAPTISPTPGDLEREYRARERSNDNPPPAAPQRPAPERRPATERPETPQQQPAPAPAPQRPPAPRQERPRSPDRR